MKQPVLLCYNLPDETFRKLRLTAMRLKIRVRPVKPWEFARPLADLAGEPAWPEAEPVPGAFDDEMLVMAFFPAGLGNLFLQGLRKSGVSPIALKAVLTPVNSQWDSVMLRGEIAKEREAILSGASTVHTEG